MPRYERDTDTWQNDDENRLFCLLTHGSSAHSSVNDLPQFTTGQTIFKCFKTNLRKKKTQNTLVSKTRSEMRTTRRNLKFQRIAQQSK